MREIFRERDCTRVGYFQSVLEAEGIPTFVRNQNVSTMTQIPTSDFYPALCVVNDEDFDQALAVLRSHVVDDAGLSGQETECMKCKEKNPGNFKASPCAPP